MSHFIQNAQYKYQILLLLTKLFNRLINNCWLRFRDFQNNQGRSKGYQPQPSTGNPYGDLDYSGYHKNRM